MGKAKRLGILGAVIAVMALMVGAVSPALGSSQGAASTSSDKQQTIRVIAVFTEFDANIDVGAPGFSLGDEVVFSGNLLRNGQQVGSGRCGLHLCVHGQRGQGRGPVPHDLHPSRWTDHHPGHDRQPVAELHAADHRWFGPV